MKLHGRRSLVDPFPDEPKGMHWSTYGRLYAKALMKEEAVLAGIAGWLDRVEQHAKTL
jgi:hypothetical protein